ncbi:hemin uptake protein HemP [Methylobacterium radiotolerans]|uniref:hemin uptake protein HemP n=1 Tax=Methylobacterium radiotolerans TaxID=31998 RepID=UPI001F48BBD2|nr:hemin uptake protein HemP [Methylobacterium radiotolerans]UIY41359.1 hemin uptake protein HemP [Methylobacterium radiotolerans]
MAPAINCRYAAFLSIPFSHLKIYKEQIWSDRSMLCAEREGQRGVPAGTRAGPGAAQPVPRSEVAGEIGSARLLQGRREIVIRHGDHAYRLRVTASDKLILTK